QARAAGEAEALARALAEDVVRDHAGGAGGRLPDLVAVVLVERVELDRERARGQAEFDAVAAVGVDQVLAHARRRGAGDPQAVVRVGGDAVRLDLHVARVLELHAAPVLVRAAVEDRAGRRAGGVDAAAVAEAAVAAA